MTELQEKEFELLKLLVYICDKYNLRYYLVCGSALGAVKYQGFIPWDDDIDVALPRDDYERFLECAQKELPEWVFLQNYRTDVNYPGLGSKLRNTNTTFIEKETDNLPMHQGVFIDVFPLDGYPKTKKEQWLLERKKKYYYRRRYTKLTPPLHRDIGLTIRSLGYYFFGLFGNTNKVCRENEQLLKKYTLEDSDYWCNYANSMSEKEYAPVSQYGEGTFAEFEGLKVRIPLNYDKYLTQKYGDYRQDLPIEKQIPCHAKIVDLKKSYTEYINIAKSTRKL